MRVLMAGLSLAVAAAMGPTPVSAGSSECAGQYVQCLNDTYQLRGLLQTMADIACFAEYAGCVAADVVRG